MSDEAAKPFKKVADTVSIQLSCARFVEKQIAEL